MRLHSFINRSVCGLVLFTVVSVQPVFAESILDFSVFALGNVDLERSIIKSGLVGAKGNVVTNIGGQALDGIRAGGDVNLSRAFKTNGDVIAGGNVSINHLGSPMFGAQSDVIAGGSITLSGAIPSLPAGQQFPNTVPVPFSMMSPFQLPALPDFTAFTAGGTDKVIGMGSGIAMLTLAPGTYGTVFFSNNDTLKLSSGDYFFDRIAGSNTSTLELDLTGGPINIFVLGNVSFSNNLNVVLNGGTAADVFIETHGDFSTAAGGNIFGTIFAPNPNSTMTLGDITSGNGINFTGALYAEGNINFRNGSMLDFVPSNRFKSVPVPSTMLLFGVGWAALFVSRLKKERKP